VTHGPWSPQVAKERVDAFEAMFRQLQVDENSKIDAEHLRANLRDAFLWVAEEGAGGAGM